MKALRDLTSLLWKDLIVEARRGYELVSIAAFPLAGALTFTVLEGQTSKLSPLAFTLIITLLATLFITTTSFMREQDKATIYGLKSLPVPPSTLYLAKALYTFIMVGLVSLVTIASIHVFTGYPEIDLLQFLGLVVLFALNLSSVSALVSAITMYSEGKFVLIPLITMIYSFPIVLLSSSAIDKMLTGRPATWEFEVLLTHQLLFTAFSMGLSQLIIEE